MSDKKLIIIISKTAEKTISNKKCIKDYVENIITESSDYKLPNLLPCDISHEVTKSYKKMMEPTEQDLQMISDYLNKKKRKKNKVK